MGIDIPAITDIAIAANEKKSDIYQFSSFSSICNLLCSLLD